MSVDFESEISSPDNAYAEGLRFFNGTGMINDALTRLAHDLDRNGIEYAIIGAIALNQHGYRRFTADIDLLLTSAGLEAFHQNLVGLGYKPAFEGARKKFRTTGENIPVDVITSGEYPGDGKPKPVVFPDPETVSEMIDGVKTVSLAALIELKLASGISASDRLKDLADVQEIIKLKDLDEDLADTLNEYVRGTYLDLLMAVRSANEKN